MFAFACAQFQCSAGYFTTTLINPGAGIDGPLESLETDVDIESIAPSTGSRLTLGFVDGMLFFAFKVRKHLKLEFWTR